ncbi:rrm domain-containing protein [Cryptosporidium canis]|nr:rrm domain-containing protein [Cryptosporidium canis]
MRNLIKSIEINPTIADNHLRLIELSIKNGVGLNDAEQLYEGAISVCGLHPAEGPVIWSEYRRFISQRNDEDASLRVSKVRDLFYRQMSLPLSGLPDLLDEYRIWEEELPDESRESFEVAKEHYSRGQQEWSLRKPMEMRVQTDNVSNLQELFDAWMVYINFEKDRMLSIDYSSGAMPQKESSSGCTSCGSPTKYKFDAKDSVIMAYRRALDDLGSIRIDLWLEFANFISTTTNCPHLLSAVYSSSLQHFSTNPKLWILYLLATAEAIKDTASHFCQFNHFYGPGCKVRSSATWYPQSNQILKASNLKEMLGIILDNYLSELAHSQEIFSDSKQNALELYFVVTNSLIDISKSLKTCYETAKTCSHFGVDDKDVSGNVGVSELDGLIFGKIEMLYLKGEELLLSDDVKLVDADDRDRKEEGFHVMEESVILFYSQWLDFESMRSQNITDVAISMLGKLLDRKEERVHSVFLPLIVSVIKGRLNVQEQAEILSSLKSVLDAHPENIRAKVFREWESSENSVRYTDCGKRQRLDFAEGEPSVLYSPTIRHIPLGASSGSDGKMTQEISQCVLPLPILQPGAISSTGPKPSSITSKSMTNDEGDFVCLSEIRLRRDKRRCRRNFNESDYDTSSECSSESNSFSALIGSSGTNGGRQLFRNFTPPGTPSYTIQKVPAPVVVHGNSLKSPCSPNVSSISNLDQSNSSSCTPMGTSSIKSPGLIPQDLESKTQCTWDGREAIEPSIAPPIPPMPLLSSISSVSSVSSNSSHSSVGGRHVEKPSSKVASTEQNNALNADKTHDDQNMPPPPFTPKKSKLDRSCGGCVTRQLPTSSVAMMTSASEDSDLNSNIHDNLKITKDLPSDSEKGTLFIRFPQDQEMDEEGLKTLLLDHFSVEANQVRLVRDIKGNLKGFAYVDVEPSNADMIVDNSEVIKSLEGIGIQISASNPPKSRITRKKFSPRSHRIKRQSRKKRSQDQPDSSSTILIKNIDKSLSEEQVASHFQDSLGLKVKNICISRDPSGASRGFAFMEFFDSGDALAAHMLNETKLGSGNITVSSSTRPLTFPKLPNSKVSLGDSLNARFAPRARSKQKLPPNRTQTANRTILAEEELPTIHDDSKFDTVQGSPTDKGSLTNDDFRRLFL